MFWMKRLHYILHAQGFNLASDSSFDQLQLFFQIHFWDIIINETIVLFHILSNSSFKIMLPFDEAYVLCLKIFGNIKGETLIYYSQIICPVTLRKLSNIIVIINWHSDATQSVIFVIEWGHSANVKTLCNVGFFLHSLEGEVMVWEMYSKLELATGKLSHGSQLIPVTCWLAH